MECDGGTIFHSATTYDWAQWDGTTPEKTCFNNVDFDEPVPLPNPISTYDITNAIYTDDGSTADTCSTTFTCAGTNPQIFAIIKEGGKIRCGTVPLSSTPVWQRTMGCSVGVTAAPEESDIRVFGCGVPT